MRVKNNEIIERLKYLKNKLEGQHKENAWKLWGFFEKDVDNFRKKNNITSSSRCYNCPEKQVQMEYIADERKYMLCFDYNYDEDILKNGKIKTMVWKTKDFHKKRPDRKQLRIQKKMIEARA